MSEFEFPRVGLSIIIMKDRQILLGKRKGSHGEGFYALPGGHLEYAENFETCARREVKEETGLDLDLIDKNPVASTNDYFPQENKHYVTLFLRGRFLSGFPKVMEPDKCEEWIWFDWKNLPDKLFLPVQNLIKQGYDPFKK